MTAALTGACSRKSDSHTENGPAAKRTKPGAASARKRIAACSGGCTAAPAARSSTLAAATATCARAASKTAAAMAVASTKSHSTAAFMVLLPRCGPPNSDTKANNGTAASVAMTSLTMGAATTNAAAPRPPQNSTVTT